jgi:hypothetical protein
MPDRSGPCEETSEFRPVEANLSLENLRSIFQQIEELGASVLGEREILDRVADARPEYSLAFLRWIVRHALHPETQDDILSGEVETVDEWITEAGHTVSQVCFRRIPPTVELYRLVQFRGTFWHVIAVSPRQGTATLRLLTDYE